MIARVRPVCATPTESLRELPPVLPLDRSVESHASVTESKELVEMYFSNIPHFFSRVQYLTENDLSLKVHRLLLI